VDEVRRNAPSALRDLVADDADKVLMMKRFSKLIFDGESKLE